MFRFPIQLRNLPHTFVIVQRHVLKLQRAQKLITNSMCAGVPLGMGTAMESRVKTSVNNIDSATRIYNYDVKSIILLS